MTRSADDIGRGLEPVRAARPIPSGERIHVVGAAGSASAAALLLGAAAGAAMSACDAGEPTRYSAAAEAAGLPIAWAHDVRHVVDAAGRPLVERIAVTKAITAVRPDLPELAAARAAGIPATSCQQLIADAAATRGGELIGVAGTHGKSTTTGWVVHVLAEAGLDPSAFVGALMPAALVGGDLPSTVRLGTGRPFVVEADEYAGNFDPYRPRVGVLLNADWDHPDVFADRAAVVDVFERWIRRFDGGGDGPPVLVANAADPGVAELLPRLGDWPGRLFVTALVDGTEAAAAARRTELTGTYRTALGPAEALAATYAARADGTTELGLHGPGGLDGRRVALRLVGRHNADDALAVVGCALAVGVDPGAILRGLASFEGVGRRFELKAEVGGVAVIDDYGHHPTAIAATLEAAALRYPGRRRWAIYEPLTFHRTAALRDAFAEVLARADRVAIADIFAVRDLDTTIASATDLAAAVTRRGTPALAPGSVEATADAVAAELEPGDVVLVMGGGRSHIAAERLVAHLRRRAEATAG